jgi:hypothetical protein
VQLVQLPVRTTPLRPPHLLEGLIELREVVHQLGELAHVALAQLLQLHGRDLHIRPVAQSQHGEPHTRLLHLRRERHTKRHLKIVLNMRDSEGPFDQACLSIQGWGRVSYLSQSEAILWVGVPVSITHTGKLNRFGLATCVGHSSERQAVNGEGGQAWMGRTRKPKPRKGRSGGFAFAASLQDFMDL